MKKIILAVLIIVTCAANTNAQLQRENYFIGTTLGAASYNFGTSTFDYSNTNLQTQRDKAYTIEVDPAAGIFLSDHFVLGGNLDLSYSHDFDIVTNTVGANLSSNHTINTTAFTVGPFARYYFFHFIPTDAAIYIQANAGVGSGLSSTAITYFNMTNTTNENIKRSHDFVFEGGAGFGFTYFIQDDIGLDAGVTYLYQSTKYTNTTSSVTDTDGVIGGKTSTYKASQPANGLGLSVGFHLFVQ